MKLTIPHQLAMVGMVGRMVGRCRLPYHPTIVILSTKTISYFPDHPRRPRGLLPVYRTHPSRSIDAELPKPAGTVPRSKFPLVVVVLTQIQMTPSSTSTDQSRAKTEI